MLVRKLDDKIFEIPVFKILKDRNGNEVEVEIGSQTFHIDELKAKRQELDEKISAIELVKSDSVNSL